jgi:ABC-type multidrug transport system ATPase subunit
MGGIVVDGLAKLFQSTVAVQDIDLDIAEGSLVTLLGPSGCGKTTTLRCVAGLAAPRSSTSPRGRSCPPTSEKWEWSSRAMRSGRI